MDDELGKRAHEHRDRYRRDTDTAPSAADVLAAIEGHQDDLPVAIGAWTLVTAQETPRHLVVLLARPYENGHMDREWIFEMRNGDWQSRGGSGGASALAPDRRPGPNEPPVLWLGLTTLHPHAPWNDTVRVTGGVARADVAKIVVTIGGEISEVDVGRRGWFHVVLVGKGAATLAARDAVGRDIVGHDGLPATLRIEPPPGGRGIP